MEEQHQHYTLRPTVPRPESCREPPHPRLLGPCETRESGAGGIPRLRGPLLDVLRA